MKEVLYDHFNYVLSEKNGRYEMVILANVSAVYYTKVHILTEDEVKKFKEHGKDFIDSLADKYRHGNG